MMSRSLLLSSWFVILLLFLPIVLHVRVSSFQPILIPTSTTTCYDRIIKVAQRPYSTTRTLSAAAAVVGETSSSDDDNDTSSLFVRKQLTKKDITTTGERTDDNSGSSLSSTRTSTSTSTNTIRGGSTTRRSSSSNLSLLDHVNFNVPNHEYIMDFYLDILGCGLDPKVAVNLMTDNTKSFGREGLIWVSCGPNQFHFPRDTQGSGQVLPGHIGLRYQSLVGLKKRLAITTARAKHHKTMNNTKCCVESYEIVVEQHSDDSTSETVQIQDYYGNIFHCREEEEQHGPNKKEWLTQYKQSVVKRSDQDQFGDVALRYGLAVEEDDEDAETESDCRGIEYVEFKCRMGTAHKIALFYESIFDATTDVVNVVQPQKDNNRTTRVKVAYIALGEIDASTGQASQYLRFRETPVELPEYDGHHIALYIGTQTGDTQNFEYAFQKAKQAGLLSTNWRDKMDVLTLEDATSQSQFRIDTIIDVDVDADADVDNNTHPASSAGQPPILFQLEHEIRSVKHPTWPGRKRSSRVKSSRVDVN